MRLIGWIGILVLCLPAVAAAAPDDAARIAYIQNALNQSARHSQYWQYGWLAVMTANTALSVVAWQKPLDHHRDDLKKQRDLKRVGEIDSITGLLSTGDMLLSPMRTHRYAAQLTKMPAQTAEQLRAKLAQAELFLEESAAFEAYQHSNDNRMLSLFVNLSAALAIGFSTDETDTAWQGFLLSTAVTEIKAYSAPNRLRQVLIDYRLNQKNAAALVPTSAPKWQFGVFATANSVAFSVDF